jgi:hypothetical protein
MQLTTLPRVPTAFALASILAFTTACSGPAGSLSPTGPSAAVNGAASSSALVGAAGDPIDPCEEVVQAAGDPIEPNPCEPPCEETFTATSDEPVEPCEPPPPPPPPPGDEGCTPGYWKNHLGSWAATGYSTGQSLTGVFGGNALSGSLLDALNFGGGSGVDGAKRNLLRAAVAALLNAAHPGVDYTRTTAAVISSVTTALNSGDRATMLGLASALDLDNNLGCPIS